MGISTSSSSILFDELTKSEVNIKFTGELVYGYPVWFPGDESYGIVEVEAKTFVMESFQPFSITFNKKFHTPSSFPFNADKGYADHFKGLVQDCYNEIDRNIRLRINKWEILDYLSVLALKLTQILKNFVSIENEIRMLGGKIFVNRNLRFEYEQQNDWHLAKYVDFSLSQYWIIQIEALKQLVDTINSRITIIQNTDDYVKAIESAESGKLIWLKTDTDLLELIVALHESGSLQNISKNISQKESIRIVASLFNRDIKDIHKKLNAARNRKKEDSTFLSKLQASLDEYYQKLDEKL